MRNLLIIVSVASNTFYYYIITGQILFLSNSVIFIRDAMEYSCGVVGEKD